MTDLFEDKAEEWDSRPVPQQISEGVSAAMREAVELREDMKVMDFGAGTGLVAGKIAPHVGRILAVDISEAMLAKLSAKPELAGKVDVFCQDILEQPLEERVDLIVSAMAMHHVASTSDLLAALFDHLEPGGRVAIADLDAEEGDFHPPEAEGVYHFGFDRDALGELVSAAGFEDVAFTTACTVARDEKSYPIFLLTASRPA